MRANSTILVAVGLYVNMYLFSDIIELRVVKDFV